MLNLYSLTAVKFPSLFGTEPNLTPHPEVTIIAQKPNCSSFLVLSSVAHTELVAKATIPTGYVFTYCQQWGLTINDAVIYRVKKEINQKTLDSLTVTVNGNTYDANEPSQQRMSRKIQLHLTTDLIDWKLSDNTIVNVPVADLKEAMRLAMVEQANLVLTP